ncbi:MAG: ABC transporter ATP-binding protein [Gammaproteobacteria bacterium]|nr:ABC transporter ATP-binding protein [Gammaproteobacteria bacterium]
MIEVRSLVKRFGALTAVNGVDLAIQPGCCFGLLGPNGAGKTTTIEIMEGISDPTAGEVLYCGRPLGRRFRSEVGIQFQHTALQDYLKVKDVLELFRNLYPNPLPLADLVEMCALSDFMDRETQKLSGGQRQRVLLAIALVNDPELIFLDEPTTGLDPQSRRNFWSLIRGIKSRNKTIILTTHYMEEADTLCDEIAIMDEGKIIIRGTPSDLLRQYFDDLLLQLPLSALPHPHFSLSLPHELNDGGISIRSRDVNRTITTLQQEGVDLARLHIRPRTLEDLFLQLTGHQLRA